MDSFADAIPAPEDDQVVPSDLDRPPHRHPLSNFNANSNDYASLVKSIEQLSYKLDNEARKPKPSDADTEDLVSKTKVLRNGALIVIVLSVLMLVGNRVSGQTIISPFVGMALVLIGSVFYLMSNVKNG